MIKILYVDDEAAFLDLTKLYLERMGGFEIETADSAYKALELLDKNQYDAIISDFQMPRMDGIQFLKKVRTSGNKVPFIIFTVKSREEVSAEGLKADNGVYLQKGGDVKTQFTELVHRVTEAVQ